jgi:hypothetical protein
MLLKAVLCFIQQQQQQQVVESQQIRTTNCGEQLSTVHFLRILQWWGKTAKGPIFLALPQHSMRSPKV